MQTISNQQIAEMLREIGEYLAMQNIPFKPRAFEKAALTIEGLEEEVSEIYKKGGGGKDGLKALKEIPGVGASIAASIEEAINTGKMKDLERLRKSTPVRLDELSRIEGLGPKSVQKLYKALSIRNLKDLEKAARAGKIAALPGFGKKTEENILKSIGFAATSGQRFFIGHIMPQIRRIEERLRLLPESKMVTIAGSARRWKETVGDADILVVSQKPAPIMRQFVSMPEVVRVIAHGDTKSSVKVRGGLNVDLRVVPEESYGAALAYFTGSKDHNVAMRQTAIKRGWKLNEYGLFKATSEKGRAIGKEKMIAGRTEAELYETFGMDYIEPELRENTGELEAARRHALPKLVGYGDLQGDLQVQTDWTDGSDSIESMARVAMARGLKYIAITDHTKRLAMANGLDEKRILKQMAEIDKLNKKFAGKIKILKGSECDILKDGTLDLPDSVLSKLDVVGASVHSFFNLPRTEQTKRIARAMENPNVDILFHPTGRIVNKRAPYDVDVEELIRAAKRTGTIMEIDALERLDLKDEYIRKCVEAGVRMSIDSDAHSPSHYSSIEYGIAQARRGWAEKKDIINSWPVEKMLKSLK
ncbi:MAG: DNA polymerase/3'-5' exonuclease PolX [Patescibacteria group bacterium]|nr:DNA polymerase/3'-5' exonuclease PolX [Patescibacteria group bacterium]